MTCDTNFRTFQRGGLTGDATNILLANICIKNTSLFKQARKIMDMDIGALLGFKFKGGGAIIEGNFISFGSNGWCL